MLATIRSVSGVMLMVPFTSADVAAGERRYIRPPPPPPPIHAGERENKAPPSQMPHTRLVLLLRMDDSSLWERFLFPIREEPGGNVNPTKVGFFICKPNPNMIIFSRSLPTDLFSHRYPDLLVSG